MKYWPREYSTHTADIYAPKNVKAAISGELAEPEEKLEQSKNPKPENDLGEYVVHIPGLDLNKTLEFFDYLDFLISREVPKLGLFTLENKVSSIANPDGLPEFEYNAMQAKDFVKSTLHKHITEAFFTEQSEAIEEDCSIRCNEDLANKGIELLALGDLNLIAINSESRRAYDFSTIKLPYGNGVAIIKENDVLALRGINGEELYWIDNGEYGSGTALHSDKTALFYSDFEDGIQPMIRKHSLEGESDIGGSSFPISLQSLDKAKIYGNVQNIGLADHPYENRSSAIFAMNSDKDNLYVLARGENFGAVDFRVLVFDKNSGELKHSQSIKFINEISDPNAETDFKVAGLLEKGGKKKIITFGRSDDLLAEEIEEEDEPSFEGMGHESGEEFRISDDGHDGEMGENIDPGRKIKTISQINVLESNGSFNSKVIDSGDIPISDLCIDSENETVYISTLTGLIAVQKKGDSFEARAFEIPGCTMVFNIKLDARTGDLYTLGSPCMPDEVEEGDEDHAEDETEEDEEIGNLPSHIVRLSRNAIDKLSKLELETHDEFLDKAKEVAQAIYC